MEDKNLKSEIVRPAIKQPMPQHAKRVFNGVVFDVYQWEQEMYDGTKKTFEKLKRPDTVVIIPVTKEKNILISNEEQPGKGSFVNLPGGRVEDGESILEACQRELLEETGYEADSFEEWFSLQPTSKMDYIIYFIVAKGCKQVQKQALDNGEKIETREVSFEEFYDIVLEQSFADKDLKLELLLADKQGKLEEIKNLFFSK
jgi:ADP-ribose pyrophosphatase